MTYGAENWIIKKRDQNRIIATEMEFWRRCNRVTRADRIRNEDIRRRMSVEQDIITYIEEKRLIWYGHVRRAPPDRWITRVTDWSPLGRRKRGRPRRSFRDEVDQAMAMRNLEEGSWNDKEEWRSRLREGRQRQL